MLFIEDLKKIQNKIIDELKLADSFDTFEELKNRYLSRKGELTLYLKGLGNLPSEERKEAGMMANQVKTEIEAQFNDLEKKFSGSASNQAGSNFFDTTLPGIDQKIGSQHPLTQVQAEVEEVFKRMGFIIYDGPQLESDWYNFESLNIPQDHPSRDMQDTFYVDYPEIDSKLVMRTQTSNLQVRALQELGAPLKVLCPGRVYRNEATDARHEHTFHQIECLMVDKGISLGHLKAVIDAVVKSILGKNFKTRIRPGFFPFVEPGLETDLSCALCGGKGCKVCKGTGWVELMGSGLVHPNVLKAAGVDPKIYSGLAFGFGIERIAMMKYGIDDIRLFQSGDLRFLKQF